MLRKHLFLILLLLPGIATSQMIQEPKLPLPYATEEVVFVNEKAGVTLSGTLTLPNRAESFPAVLLIAGQGPEDRNASSSKGHKIFFVLSDHLTRQGIAVLRYDKRGVKGSTGNFGSATIEDFSEDAMVGFEYLKGRKEIDPRKVGIIGYSEGGYFAPWIASRSKDVAFLVSMAGAGLNGRDIYQLQLGSVMKAEGISDSFIAKAKKLDDRILKALSTSKGNEDAKQAVREILTKEREEMAKKNSPSEFDRYGLGFWFSEDICTSSWWRYYRGFDPRPFLQQVTCPFLAVYGGKDLYVPPRENISAIQKALKAGTDPEFSFKIFPGLSHFFQTCKYCLVGEMNHIPVTIEPEVLEYISNWINKHVE